MSFLSGIGDMLKQYSGGNAPAGNPEEHFDQVAQNVPCSTVAGGLASALGSAGSGGFGEMASKLFANGSGGAQAGMLGTLLASAGPSVLAQFSQSHPGSPLTGMLQQGLTSLTPQQAAAVDPNEVQALAANVHQENPGIIGKISEIYAEHPTAIKALGAGALAIAMKHISENHNA
jgi:hypothetical protein